MKKDTLKTIALCLLAAVICFVCVLAEIQTEITVYKPLDSDIVASYKKEDITAFHSCAVAENDTMKAIGADPYIVFNGITEKASTVELKLSENAKNAIEAQLYYGTDNEFSEVQSVKGVCFNGSDFICFALPEGAEFNCLRIDIEETYRYGEVLLHSSAPETVTVTTFSKAVAALVAVLASLIGALIVFIADKKLRISGYVFGFLSRNKRKIIFTALSLIICIDAGMAADRIIYGTITVEKTAFFTGILLVLMLLVFGIKTAGKSIEVIIFGLILIVGSVMILSSPFGHISWDVDSHYGWALRDSSLKGRYITQADADITGINEISLLSADGETNAADIAQMNEDDTVYVAINHKGISPSHILPGLFIAVARLFGASFYVKFIAGEFAALLTYAVAMFFAAKSLKSGKIILALFALLPTNLFLATNYSYDYIVTAFITLGCCRFIGEIQQPDKPVSLISSAVTMFAIGIGTIPKLIYMPLMLIPFFMYKKKEVFTNKKAFYKICIASVIFFCALFIVRSMTILNAGGDMRGGSDISSSRQISYILSNPFEYAETLILFLCDYLSPLSSNLCISHFAYLGVANYSYVFLILLLIAVFTDKNENDSVYSLKYNTVIKTVSILLLLGEAALIATALYLDYTPVGASTVKGCQPRYLLPLLIFPIMLLGNAKYTRRFKFSGTTVYKYLMLVPAVAVLFQNIYQMMLY